MFDLKAGYMKFDDFCRSWMNKVAATDVEKVTALEQLRSAIEREAKLQEEVSRLIDDLASSGAELESAHKNILALESQVKSKNIRSIDFDGSEMDAS